MKMAGQQFIDENKSSQLPFYPFKTFSFSRWVSFVLVKPNIPRIFSLLASVCSSVHYVVSLHLLHPIGRNVMPIRRKIFKTLVYGNYVCINIDIIKMIYKFLIPVVFGFGPMKCIDFEIGLFHVRSTRKKINCCAMKFSSSLVSMGTSIRYSGIHRNYCDDFQFSHRCILCISLAMAISANLVYFIFYYL